MVPVAFAMGGLASLLGATEGKRGDKPGPDDAPDKPKKKAPAPKEEDAEPVTAAKTDAPTDPAQEWLSPIKEKFLEARKNGASMAELQRMILTLHPRTKALAEAFAKNILAGLKGEEGEAVTAASDNSRRRKDPLEMPDGTKCYTENCERHDDNEYSKDSTRKHEDSHLDLKAGFSHPAVGKTGDWQSLGLEEIDEIDADPASKTEKGQELAVIRMLQKNNIVNSADGYEVKFGPELLKHWVERAKTEKDKMGRLKHIRDAVRAVYAPHEIWEQADKQRTYFRVYKDEKGAFYMAGFVVDNTNEVRSLIYTRKRGTARGQRKGTLRYKR